MSAISIDDNDPLLQDPGTAAPGDAAAPKFKKKGLKNRENVRVSTEAEGNGEDAGESAGQSVRYVPLKWVILLFVHL